MSGTSRVPVSTYRIQLHRGFTFRDLAATVPYLDALGVTDLYLSPVLAARPGSMHGYDICDHGRLNPELGDVADYRSLVATLTDRSMGLVLDFVPNHMGIDPRMNRWWRDVLANGPGSRWARTFDIDWDPLKAETRGKVLLPILGAPYGEVLEGGELLLERDGGRIRLRYFDHDLPLNARGLAAVIDADAFPPTDPSAAELRAVALRLAGGDRSGEVLARLAALLEGSASVRRHVDARLEALAGRPGDAASFDPLHEILERQSYRLAYWKTAFHEINYRRFFDINDLAGIRVEDPEVFEATHAFLLELVAGGGITGIRLDHIDGLFDPAGYLERLRERVGDLWIVVEKILCEGEVLPSSWPVAGTTGYEFLNDLNGIFVDCRHARPMRRLYRRFTSRTAPFPIVTYVGKRLIMQTSMASELSVLADGLNRISEGDRRSRDFTLESLREALREVIACFPVYRTYVSARGASDTDRRTIDAALALARRRNPAMEPSIFEFVRTVLLPDGPERDAAERLTLAMRFQQYTGPVQAKGVEDTAFYRYNVLLSLNEVGGEPERFGRTAEEFHEANLRRRSDWPHSMLATATHDTKRGEDARARLNVLSEIPGEWQSAVSRWARLNASRRVRVDGEWAPDRNEETLYYQSLLAVWPPGEGAAAAPSLVERLQQYLVKALREAKLRTSWTNPHEAWEGAVTGFVERTLTGGGSRRFLEAFLPFAARVARLGASNSLAQLALKLAAPGIPDVYQGTELWDLSLVDPDNRRPVDYERRRSLLAALDPWLADGAVAGRDGAVAALLADWPDGRIKLYLTARALRLRRTRRDLFLEGDYVPLVCEPAEAIAFTRRRGEERLVVVAARFPSRKTGEDRPFPTGTAAWKDARVLLPDDAPRGPLVDLFTGRRIAPDGSGHLALAEALAVLPVAWLVGL